MNAKVRNCLLEATRRYLVHKSDHQNLSGFLGLGYLGEYKDAVKQGYFSSVSNPVPRTLGWYRLTEKGKMAVNQLLLSGITEKDFDGFSFISYNKLPVNFN